MIFFLLATAPIDSEEIVAKKVNAHLLIEDPQSAIQTAKAYLHIHPESKAMRLALVRALCESGKEVEALERWNEVSQEHQDLISDRAALETLAWGVLKKGSHSKQLLIQLFSMLGAALTHDAQGIPFIIEQLRSSNGLMRATAVTLAAEYGDLPLRDELVRLLKEERSWNVRLEVIKAVGKLRMSEQKETLKEILAHPKTLAEEKAAAIVALVSLYEGIDDKELIGLIQSNRAGLRQLACEVISHLDLGDKIPLMLPLLSDSSPIVRLSALNTLALLGANDPKVNKLMRDRAPEVAITAAWLGMIRGDAQGKERLKAWMRDNDPKWRRLASAAVSAGGKEGALLAREMLEKVSDPYVVVNLSLGLIGQRQSVQRACEAIDAALKAEEELWMWDTAHNPLFQSLAPSTVGHIPQVPDYPSAVDQLTRLELLSVLCMLHYPHALEAVKGFLQKSNWGATGAAATTLVTEGDEEAMNVVRKLLKDSDEKVRIQAALILTLLGSDPEAIKTLEDAYVRVDRELKIRILETLAQVGDPHTIPFLLGILNEPFQSLRVIAASAIIQCLSN